MSTSFFIKNAPGKPCITFGEAVKIGENISQYVIGEESKQAGEYLAASLERFECVLLGEEGKCARGFELGYDPDTDSYSVRLFTPCGLGDWEAAFSYIQKLGAYLQADTVMEEEGTVYPLGKVTNYPYRENILYGIQSYHRALKEHGLGHAEIYGLYRPVAMNKEMLEEVLSAKDPVQEFTKLITSIQYLDAFSATQKFYDMDGELCGAYTLTEDVRTILPFKPSVSFENSESIDSKDVKGWKIMLVIINGDPNDPDAYQLLGYTDYSRFIQKLPKDKYSFIDAVNILVEPLTQQEIKAILD